MSDPGSAPIDIQIDDKVSPTIAPKILSIAEAAREADSAILHLRAQISGLDKDAVSITAFTKAVDGQTAAYLKNETALNKAVKAEADARVSSQRLATEYQNTGAATMKAEAALNSAVVAEGRATTATLSREQALIAATKAAHDAEMAQQAYNSVLGVSVAPVRGSAAGSTALADQLRAEQLVEAESVRLTAAQAKVMQSLRTTAETAGMSKAELLEYKAAQLGLTAQAAPWIAQLRNVEEAEGRVGHATASITRETVVLGREAVNGNWTRMAGSMTLLAQYTGVLQAIMSPLGLTIIAATAAAAAFALALSKGQSEEAKYNNLLRATGDFAGYTYGQLKQLEQEAANRLNVTLGTSAEVFRELTASGRVTGQELQNIANISLKLSQMTGESADKIASEFSHIKGSVTDFAITFNEQFHVLSAAQIDYIRQLEQMGQKEQAEEALASQVWNGVKNAAVEQLGYIERAIKNVKDAASDMWEYLKSIGRDATQQENVLADKAEIARLKASIKSNTVGGSVTEILGEVGGVSLEEQLSNAQAKLRFDELDAKASQDIAKWQAQGKKEQEQAIDAGKTLNETINSMAKGSELFATHVRDARAQLQTLERFDPTSPLIKLLADPSKKSAQFPLGDLKDSVLQNLKQKFDPADVKAEREAAQAAEQHSRAIDKINLALDDEIARMNMLKPQREAQAIADRYEVDMAGKKIAMSAEEKAAILEKAEAIIRAKEVQQEEDRIYTQIIKPMSDYKNTLQAITLLEQQNAISTSEAAAQRMAAAIKLKEATDPFSEQIAKLSAENVLLGLVGDAYATETALFTAQMAAQKAGNLVKADELAKLRDLLRANEDIKALHQQLVGIYNQNAGAIKQLAVQIVALNIAKQRGIITDGQFKLSMTQLGAEALKLKLQMGQADFSDVLLSGLSKVIQGYKGLMPTLADDFGNLFDNIANQGSAAIGAVLTKTESLRDAVHQVSTSILSDFIGALVKLGIQWVIQQTIGESLQAAATASSSAAAATLTAEWESAAMAASIATLGGADAVGEAAFMAAMSLSKAMSLGSDVFAPHKEGGYITGPGGPRDDKIKASLSNGEFVVNAHATASNRALLEAINNGMRLPFDASGDAYSWLQAPKTSNDAASTPSAVYNTHVENGSQGIQRIVIEDHRKSATPLTLETKHVSRDEIRLIARDEGSKAVHDHAPRVIERELANANSRVSKAIEGYTYTRRKSP